MKARIKLIEGVTLLGESESGHSVVIDGAPEIGGRGLGVRPMEMVLLGLGGCTAMDVPGYLAEGAPGRGRLRDRAERRAGRVAP